MDLGLAGKRILITGGSRGIGRAIAELFVAEGANVGICSRDAAGVDKAVAEIGASGGAIHGRAVDVADRAALESWINDSAAAMGGLDAFIPGVSVGGGPEKWDAAFHTDLMGTVRGCEAAIPHLRAAGGGAIVLISTTGAIEIWRDPMAYNVMKAGLLNYAKNLSNKVAVDQIRVNAVAPGPIYFEGGAWETIKANLPDFFAEVSSSIPMGRMGTPADVAKAVAFYASDAASYISGTTLVVDGGRTRRVDY